MTTPNPSTTPAGGTPVTEKPLWDEVLRGLLAAPPRRCTPARYTGRALVGRERRVVPVAAPGRAV